MTVRRKLKSIVKSKHVDTERYLKYIANPDTVIDKNEIRDLVRSFDKVDLHFQAVLLSIDMTKSYEQFGRNDMKDFIKNEIKISYDKGFKILQQARIAYAAGGVSAVGKYSGNALYAMKDLEPDEQREVLSHALKAHEGKITGPIIKASIEALGYEDEISEQLKKTKDKIAKIYGAIKGSKTRSEFLKNFTQAIHDHLKVKDIDHILKKLEKL